MNVFTWPASTNKKLHSDAVINGFRTELNLSLEHNDLIPWKYKSSELISSYTHGPKHEYMRGITQ